MEKTDMRVEKKRLFLCRSITILLLLHDRAAIVKDFPYCTGIREKQSDPLFSYASIEMRR